MVDNWSQPMTVEEMYGEWDYEAAVELLERSLDPRPSSAIFDTVASLGVGANHVVLDIGGRDGSHGLKMAERFGCRVVSVDPSPANIKSGIEAVSKHDSGLLVDVRLGAIEQIPADAGSFNMVFSRDMMGHVADLDAGLAECHRVLVPGGWMVVHTVFATELMEPREERRLCAETATAQEGMSSARFEEAVESAGFSIETVDVVGSEWYEASQEASVAPNYALQISRLRRAKEELVEEMGEFAYRSMYANALWSIYLLIGKLETRLYVLQRRSP